MKARDRTDVSDASWHQSELLAFLTLRYSDWIGRLRRLFFLIIYTAWWDLFHNEFWKEKRKKKGWKGNDEWREEEKRVMRGGKVGQNLREEDLCVGSWLINLFLNCSLSASLLSVSSNHTPSLPLSLPPPVFISHLSDSETCRWNRTRPRNLFRCFCRRSFPLLRDDIHLSAASASLKWIHLPFRVAAFPFIAKRCSLATKLLKDGMRIGVVMTQWVQLYSRNIRSDSWYPLHVISLLCSSSPLTAVMKMKCYADVQLTTHFDCFSDYFISKGRMWLPPLCHGARLL